MLSGATERNTLQSESETVPTPVHRPTELEPYVFQAHGTVVRCSLLADRAGADPAAVSAGTRFGVIRPGRCPQSAIAEHPALPWGHLNGPAVRWPSADGTKDTSPGIRQTNSATVKASANRTLHRSVHKQSLRSAHPHPASAPTRHDVVIKCGFGEARGLCHQVVTRTARQRLPRTAAPENDGLTRSRPNATPDPARALFRIPAFASTTQFGKTPNALAGRTGKILGQNSDGYRTGLVRYPSTTSPGRPRKWSGTGVAPSFPPLTPARPAGAVERGRPSARPRRPP